MSSEPNVLTSAKSLRLLKIMQLIFGAHMVMVVFMAEYLRSPEAPELASEVYFAFCGMAVLVVAGFFFIRSQLPQVESTLRLTPEDRAAVGKRQQIYIVLLAMSEAMALFGFVSRFLGSTVAQAVPFYVIGFFLLLLCAPRKLD